MVHLVPNNNYHAHLPTVILTVVLVLEAILVVSVIVGEMDPHGVGTTIPNVGNLCLLVNFYSFSLQILLVTFTKSLVELYFSTLYFTKWLIFIVYFFILSGFLK
jgi:hypothetical protein